MKKRTEYIVDVETGPNGEPYIGDYRFDTRKAATEFAQAIADSRSKEITMHVRKHHWQAGFETTQEFIKPVVV